MLPIPMHSVLLPELISGLDGCLQHYVLKAKSGCGTFNESLNNCFQLFISIITAVSFVIYRQPK